MGEGDSLTSAGLTDTTAAGGWRPTGGTVLVVEDEPSISQLVRTYLIREGYRVVCVRSGGEALAEVDRAGPRLVVLDIGLPDMDGKELCRRLRENPATCSTPIIAFTGYGMPREVQDALKAGCNAVIVKPCAFPAVMEELQRQLPSKFRAPE